MTRSEMLDRTPVLEVSALTKSYAAGNWSSRKAITTVHNVDFRIHRGETFGLIGESGSGKSTIARMICMLSDVTSGDVLFNGRNITNLGDKAAFSVRRDMQPIFQDPQSSINPRMKVFNYIAEPARIHGLFKSRAELTDHVHGLLQKVGLAPSAAQRFPHEFSGGQRQRLSIARALSLNPSFIVADEPISALDVSIQAQVLNLLIDLKRELDLTYLFISHDLRIVRHMCDRMAVLYRGVVVETGETQKIFANPQHAYTRLLIDSSPIADPKLERERLARFNIDGLQDLEVSDEQPLRRIDGDHFARV
ncbi:ATP-binding cassette domain-containing protein [Salipiger mucosus]|nr:ATP-binding cassette domain-containing protein [Salipiger mucosus]